MIVTNSSPIIILGKQGLLELLKKCFQKVIIPQSVYEEITQKNDTPEAIALEKAMNDKWIVIEDTDIIPMLRTQRFGQGEKEAISLAVKHGYVLLIDDDFAKKYASIFGIKSHGTLYVIYIACVKGFIEKDAAISVLKDMMKDGFYVSAEIYSKFIELLESLKK